ncbi:MAG: hypothetical protein MJA84_07265 [Firmicutes bacterium]|nr:hypothetical protein [Bacillota bacterium]
MRDKQYYSTEDLKYISFGVLAEKILISQGKISKLIELQEELLKTDDRNQISKIFDQVVEPRK